MVADRIEEFISALKDKTQQEQLDWQILSQLPEHNKIKREIEKLGRSSLKNYFIDEEKSYCLYKCRGYVIILYLQYSKAAVFSPSLDRRILLVQISKDFPFQNLSLYNAEDGYDKFLQELSQIIERQRQERDCAPDNLYAFFNKILEEE